MFSIVKSWSRFDRLKDQESKGKPTRVMTGSYIDDLATLGKCIWLCGLCINKFNANGYSYEVKQGLPQVRGNCDGCKANGTHTMFVHKDHCDGWRGK